MNWHPIADLTPIIGMVAILTDGETAAVCRFEEKGGSSYAFNKDGSVTHTWVDSWCLVHGEIQGDWEIGFTPTHWAEFNFPA